MSSYDPNGPEILQNSDLPSKVNSKNVKQQTGVIGVSPENKK